MQLCGHIFTMSPISYLPLTGRMRKSCIKSCIKRKKPLPLIIFSEWYGYFCWISRWLSFDLDIQLILINLLYSFSEFLCKHRIYLIIHSDRFLGWFCKHLLWYIFSKKTMHIFHIVGNKRTNSRFILRKKTCLSKLEKSINFVKIAGDLLHLVFVYTVLFFLLYLFAFASICPLIRILFLVIFHINFGQKAKTNFVNKLHF